MKLYLIIFENSFLKRSERNNDILNKIDTYTAPLKNKTLKTRQLKGFLWSRRESNSRPNK